MPEEREAISEDEALLKYLHSSLIHTVKKHTLQLKAGEDAPDGEKHLYKLPSFSEKMCKKLMEIKFSQDDVQDLKHLIKLERAYEEYGKLKRLKKRNFPREFELKLGEQKSCLSITRANPPPAPTTTLFHTETLTKLCTETITELAC